MSVEYFPAVRNPGPPPATLPQANRKVDSSFDAIWAAWIERGRQHDRAVNRKIRIVLLGMVVVGLLAALFFGLAGGAL
jgi:hypothetical protein